MSGTPSVAKAKTPIRLLEAYRKAIIPAMMEKFKYKNKLQVPRIKNIVINMGVGEGAHDIKILEKAAEELAAITGQRPVITKSKKAISNFKIQKNDPIGCKVTLRGRIMYEFLDRLVNIALPRIRDFRGVSPSGFDERGNYSLGLKEQTIFPEIEYDKVAKVKGMGIVVVMNAKNKNESFELLKLFGMPFRSA